jgi:hypothetical protein
MRIWDMEPSKLCRAHLLGEHRELHAIWAVITQGKTGYSKHPETMRWRGKLAALYERHDRLVCDMEERGYRHRSPLERKYATGCIFQDAFVDEPEAQRAILRGKGCDCKV